MKNTNDKETGGNAFPHLYEPGMTLREYYAGLAMSALLSNPNLTISQDVTASTAITYADALINKLIK